MKIVVSDNNDREIISVDNCRLIPNEWLKDGEDEPFVITAIDIKNDTITIRNNIDEIKKEKWLNEQKY